MKGLNERKEYYYENLKKTQNEKYCFQFQPNINRIPIWEKNKGKNKIRTYQMNKK